FDRAIDAVAALAPRFADLRLVVAGEGPRRAALEAQAARLGVAQHVDFVGVVDHADIPALIDRATAVVMPSRYEGMPLVALEAAGMGRPVIGTRAPGLDATVADDVTGLLVDPGDPPALAAAIEAVCVDRALATRLGHAARARAEREWSMDACVDAYE